MSVTDLVTIITGVLQFPSLVLKFLKLIQSTPEENHERILERISTEKETYENTGRPVW